MKYQEQKKILKDVVKGGELDLSQKLSLVQLKNNKVHSQYLFDNQFYFQE